MSSSAPAIIYECSKTINFMCDVIVYCMALQNYFNATLSLQSLNIIIYV